jgi:CO/xanthine dehydrogenase FAD-binding subunit
VGSQQIRNAGTLGGNICHASPAGDTLPALLVLNASLRAVGPQGERSISAADFFTGPGLTVLSPQELLIEIRLPREPGLLASYLRFSPRQYQDSAVASAAVSFTLDGAICTGCRIALGAVAPVPMRARSAEAYLLGKRLTPEALAAAADLAAAEASPISDVRGSAGYRAALVPVLVRRAAEAARAKAPD